MISDLQKKLSSKGTNEQDGTMTESMVEPALSGRELPGLNSSLSSTKEVARPADNSEALCSLPPSKALISVVPHVTNIISPAENSGNEREMEDKTSAEKRLNRDGRGDHWCESVGVRVHGEGDEETRDGEADKTRTELVGWRELSSTEESGGGAMLSGVGHKGLGSGGQVMPGVRDELQTALAQLEEEEKRWEMELASQQKEREVSKWRVKFR